MSPHACPLSGRIFFPTHWSISDAGTVGLRNPASSRGWTDRGNPMVSDSCASFTQGGKSGNHGIFMAGDGRERFEKRAAH